VLKVAGTFHVPSAIQKPSVYVAKGVLRLIVRFGMWHKLPPFVFCLAGLAA